MKRLNELRAELDVLNIEFGDDELFRRNAEFSARFRVAEQHAERRATVVVFAVVALAVSFALLAGATP